MKNNAYLRFAAAVIFVALGIYLGAEIFFHGSGGQRTVTAEYVSVSDEAQLRGTVFREEKIICGEGELFIIPAEGEWLRAGDCAAVEKASAEAWFDTEKAEKSIDSAEEISSAVFAFSMSKNVEERQLAAAEISRLLFGEDGGENEHYTLPKGEIPASASGYFSRFTDGYEGLSPLAEEGSRRPEKYKNAIGKTVGGACWYFRAELDAKTLEKLGSSSAVSLDGCPAEILSVSGKTVVFRMKSGVEAHLTDRERTLTLTLCEYEGIRLPARAVIDGGDGKYIRILRTGSVETLPVEIIYAADDFCIVEGEGLLRGMQVVLP